MNHQRKAKIWLRKLCFMSMALLIASTYIVQFPVYAAAETWSQFGRIGPISSSNPGGFISPKGVVVDSSGNVYVADTSNHRIQKLTLSTNTWSEWKKVGGGVGSGLGEFNGPSAVAVDSSGNVYVADSGNHRIQKLTLSTNTWSEWKKVGGGAGIGLGEFNNPRGVAVDSSGNVYVADSSNHRIQKLTLSTNRWSEWRKSSGAGVTGSGLGEFNFPNGMAVDSSGNIYVGDTFNHRIQKLTLSTNTWSEWKKVGGGSGSGLGEFNNPRGVALDSNGNVYVADSANYRIQKLTLSTNTWSEWKKVGGGTGNGLGEFISPNGVAVDRSGNVYVADDGHTVQKLSAANNTWTQSSVIGPVNGNIPGEFAFPRGVSVDSSGNVYVADTFNHRIQKLTLSTNTWSEWKKVGGGAGSGLGEFSNPTGVSVDSSGNVYVADSSNHRIQKLTLSTNTWSEWKKVGGGAGNGLGEFNSPNGVAVDSSGNLYVTDTFNHRIQKLTLSTNTWSEWKKVGGGAGSGLGEFSNPYGLGVDSSGNVYVADSGNLRIQKLTLSTNTWSEWKKVGGGAGSGLGEFSNPTGVSVDSSGNVYVADSSNHRIQKLTESTNTWSEWKKSGSSNGTSLGEFYNPYGLSVDSSGNMYVADTFNHRIQKLTVPATPAVTRVVVDPSSKSVVQGGSQQLTAEVSAVGGAEQTVTWTSSDVSGKVAVDSTGKVTVAGDAALDTYTITATSTFDGSKQGTATITVTERPAIPAVTSVVVSPSSKSVIQGGSQQLTAEVSAVGGAEQTVTWTSSDVSGKVAVDSTGKVTVAGDAALDTYTITATSTFDGSKQGTATITVTERPAIPAVTSIVVSPSSKSVVQGGSQQLSAEVSAVGGAEQTVIWTSSDVSGKVAVDSTGKVTVAGDAALNTYTITATSTFDGSKQGTATITVTERPAIPAVTSVVVSPSSKSVIQGGSQQLTAEVSAVGGAEQTVTWTSSDVSGKVAVDSTGKVTVAGDAALDTYTITATSTFDGSKQGTATITVTERPATPAVTSVVVSPSSKSVVQGGSQQLTAEVSAVGGAEQTVTWTSSDVSGKVAVDSTGKVTIAGDAALDTYTITATSTFDGSKQGTATITVTERPAIPAVTSVVVSPSSKSVVQGGIQQLSAEVSAVGGAEQTVIWTSSDDSGKVAVDSTGKVTVAGDAALNTYTITATSTFDGSKQGTATITVTERPAIPTPGPSTPETSTPVIVPVPVKERLTVNVEDSGDKTGRIVASAIIERTTGLDGTKKDDIHFTTEQAKKTVDSIVAAGSSSATIVIPDAKDEVKEVNIILGKDANKLITEAKIDLRIATENVKAILPFQSLAGFTDDLYFNFVPIKDQNQKQKVNERVGQDTLIKGAAGDKKVEVIGRPMMIETNMQSRSVTLVMPLRDVNLNESDMKALWVYIEHSDGTKELLKGELVPYNDKGVMGVQFAVNKFSTFTLLHIEGAEGIKQHNAYLKGYVDGTFKPENKITRAEMAAILSRVMTGNVNGAAAITFRDVSSPYWAQDAISKVTEIGLMKGYTDGTFKPENTITRAEMATIVARLLGNMTPAGTGYTDISGNWAEASILKAQKAGMISGYKDGSFKPDQAMTRAEAVKIINRLLDRVPFSGSLQSTFKDVADTYWALRDIEEASADHEYEITADGREKWVQKP